MLDEYGLNIIFSDEMFTDDDMIPYKERLRRALDYTLSFGMHRHQPLRKLVRHKGGRDYMRYVLKLPTLNPDACDAIHLVLDYYDEKVTDRHKARAFVDDVKRQQRSSHY